MSVHWFVSWTSYTCIMWKHQPLKISRDQRGNGDIHHSCDTHTASSSASPQWWSISLHHVCWCSKRRRGLNERQHYKSTLMFTVCRRSYESLLPPLNKKIIIIKGNHNFSLTIQIYFLAIVHLYLTIQTFQNSDFFLENSIAR